MDKVEIIPIGGLGEVGMNCMLLGIQDKYLVFDCGTMSNNTSWLGFDNILPDFSYIHTIKDKIEAIIITHGHEDHIGALPHLLKQIYIPKIYMSPLTASLFHEKMAEYTYDFSSEIILFSTNTIYAAGEFRFEFFEITHSYIESYFTKIESPYGNIVHSGDFKIDKKPYNNTETDYMALENIAKESCFLLLSDSTNAEKEGWSMGENEIHASLKSHIESTRGKVFITSFASNIQRTQQLLDILLKTDRYIFLYGLSVNRFIKLGEEHTYLEIPHNRLANLNNINNYEPDKVAILLSGSQGEFRSGLVRVANDLDTNLKIKHGDKVIFSSLKIPGNEINIRYLINQIHRQGGEAIHLSKEKVHVTGHAYKEEQQFLAKKLQAKNFIPIHGDYSMLKQHIANIEEVLPNINSYLLTDGDKAIFSEGNCSIEKAALDANKYWQQNGQIGNIIHKDIKFKKSVAFGGLVIVRLVIQSNQLVTEPFVLFKGILMNTDKRVDFLNLLNRKFYFWLSDYFELNRSQEYEIEDYLSGQVKKLFRRNNFLKPEVIILFD